MTCPKFAFCRLLNPLIADGQVHGAFVQGVAAALYEEFVYDPSGNFLSGSLADYLVPTVWANCADTAWAVIVPRKSRILARPI
jgi:CO/xanthine dehydrogenase Mo-binding subunit